MATTPGEHSPDEAPEEHSPAGTPPNTPPAAPQAPQNTPTHSRRRVTAGVLQAVALVAGAKVSKVFSLQHTKEPVKAAPPPIKRKEVVPSSADNWATGELTENKVSSFMMAFSQLKRDSIILIDQNGNIIYGAPIPVPADIAAKERTMESKAFQDIFQKWLNEERKKIQAAFPTVHVSFAENREEPTLLSVRKSHEESADESLFDVVLRNSQSAVSTKNHKSKMEFAKETFADSALPPELAALFIGACAAESQFSEIGTNRIGAAGPWQIMPDAAKDFGLMGTTPNWIKKRVRKGKKGPWIMQRVRVDVPFDNRNNFEKATPAAAKLIGKFYRELANQDKGADGNKSTVVMDIQKKCGVSDEDFLHQAVVNSYQAGPGRIKRMCEWFMKNYSPEDVEKILGRRPYGKDLYTLMTYVYIQSRNDPNYGKQSRDYVIRAMAMKELFASEDEGKKPEFNIDTYLPPAPQLEPEVEQSNPVAAAVKIGLKNGHLQTLGIGAVTAVTAVAIGKVLETNPTLGRRDVLVTTLGFGAAGAGRMLADRETKARQKQTEPAPVDKQPNKYGPYILDEEGISKSLLAIDGAALKHVPMRSAKERRRQKDKISVGLEIAANNHLPRFETAAQIAATSGLAHVEPYSSRNFRLRGVGMLDDSNVESDERYTYCYQHTEKLMKKIDEELNEALYAEGFPRKFKVRLIIKGLSRSEEFQKALRKKNPYAAKGDSPHMYGHTFDIHRAKFDIIDTSGQGNRFSMISTSPSDEVNQKLHMCLKISAVLGRVLIKLKDAGELTVIDEGANPVFHISDKNPKKPV